MPKIDDRSPFQLLLPLNIGDISNLVFFFSNWNFRNFSYPHLCHISFLPSKKWTSWSSVSMKILSVFILVREILEICLFFVLLMSHSRLLKAIIFKEIGNIYLLVMIFIISGTLHHSFNWIEFHQVSWSSWRN